MLFGKSSALLHAFLFIYLTPLILCYLPTLVWYPFEQLYVPFGWLYCQIILCSQIYMIYHLFLFFGGRTEHIRESWKLKDLQKIEKKSSDISDIFSCSFLLDVNFRHNKWDKSFLGTKTSCSKATWFCPSWKLWSLFRLSPLSFSSFPTQQQPIGKRDIFY